MTKVLFVILYSFASAIRKKCNMEVTKAPPMLPPAELEKSMREFRSILTTKVGDFIWITPEQAELLYDILARVCVDSGYKLPE